jgi:hypothetical protein
VLLQLLRNGVMEISSCKSKGQGRTASPALSLARLKNLAQSSPGTVVLVVTRVAETRPVNQIPGVPSVA